MNNDFANSGWQEKARSNVFDCGWFQVDRHDRVSESSGVEHDFYLVKTADWVNVVPVRNDGRLVMVRQFRHGADRFGLEVPAGIVDEGEEPLTAGKRELREETGYAAESWQALGTFASNPALLNNTVHVYLAEHAGRVSAQSTEPDEEIECVLVDPDDIPALIRSGEINNSIAIAVLHLWSMQR